MATVSTISGAHTPNEGRALINTNFTNVNTDLVTVKTITDSLSGDVVGENNAQTLTNKTIKSNNANGGTNNVVEITRKDIKTDLFQVKAYNADALAGIMSNIEVDAASIYDLVVSGGNGIKTHIDSQHLKIVGETDFLLNNTSQRFGVGVTDASWTTFTGYGFSNVVAGKTAITNDVAIGDSHAAAPAAPLHVKDSTAGIGEMIRLENTNDSTAPSYVGYKNASQR